MLENIKQFSLLNRVFDVKNNEWPKLLIAWFAKFLYKIVFVINWTLVVAIFVANMGIQSLPYLFVINAFFTILGSIFYSTFLDSFKKTTLIALTVFGSGILLFLSGLFFGVSQLMFFAALIVVESICLVQLKMLLDAFSEDLFNPLSGERVFPIIEAAETIGGIVGGVLIFSLPKSMPISNFSYLSVILIFLILPFIGYYSYVLKHKKVVLKKPRKYIKSPLGIIDKLKLEFSNKNQMKFIKGMVFIVFLQWFLFNLMEFQYTKAVYSKVSSVVIESGGGFEHAFIHDLGILFILFSVSALIIQLFLGGKIIKSLGVVGSMILHPIVTLISLVGTFANFGFATAVLAKNNFTATTIIYTNAYHSAYYAIKENTREYVREFLDGFIRPIGALLGTLVLILMQFLIPDKEIVFYLNVAMIVVTAVFLYFTYSQQDKYTAISVHGLGDKNKEERFNAIDILAQNGHKNASGELTKILLNESEDISVKVRILRAFSESQDGSAVSAISKCLYSDSRIIKEKAVDTLLSYKELRSIVSANLLLKYELLNSLKKIYLSEKSPAIKSSIIFLLSKISATSAVEFLLNVLKRDEERFKPDAIYALGNYKDSSIIEFLKPFLKSKNANQQINTAVALGRTDKYFDEASYLISSFLYSGKSEKIAYGLFAVGELKLKKEKAICFRYLRSKNVDLRMQSAVALLKMNCYEAVPVVVDLRFMKNEAINEKLKYLMRDIDVRMLKNLDKILAHVVHQKTNEIISKIKSPASFQKRDLNNLKWLYNMTEEYEDAELINKLILKKT